MAESAVNEILKNVILSKWNIILIFQWNLNKWNAQSKVNGFLTKNVPTFVELIILSNQNI